MSDLPEIVVEQRATLFKWDGIVYHGCGVYKGRIVYYKWVDDIIDGYQDWWFWDNPDGKWAALRDIDGRHLYHVFELTAKEIRQYKSTRLIWSVTGSIYIRFGHKMVRFDWLEKRVRNPLFKVLRLNRSSGFDPKPVLARQPIGCFYFPGLEISEQEIRESDQSMPADVRTALEAFKAIPKEQRIYP